MWEQLWADFIKRVQNLESNVSPKDEVDYAIKKQIETLSAIYDKENSRYSLYLPELYCGAPWKTEFSDSPISAENWVAFLNYRPYLNYSEEYPTLKTLETFGIEPTISFFEGRFDKEVHDFPMRHGRDPFDPQNRPSLWQKNGRSKCVHTWTRIENLLKNALTIAGVDYSDKAVLGDIGAIVNIVPWKHDEQANNGRKINSDLVKAGLNYCKWTLSRYQPKLIVVLGTNVRNILMSSTETSFFLENGDPDFATWQFSKDYKPKILWAYQNLPDKADEFAIKIAEGVGWRK